jgi:mono/diheme cytochrome c family protein
MRNFALLLVLLTVGMAHAQCSLRPREVYATYAHQDLYYYNGGSYYQYKGGDYGPLYSYNHGKYYPYEHKETVILVPKAIQVEVQRDHYYGINATVERERLVDEIAGRMLRMIEDKGRVGTATGIRPTSTPATRPTETPKGDSGETRAGTYQNEAMLKTINNSCVKCHGVGSKFTKFITADGKLPDLPSGKVWEAFGLVNSGEMPKGGTSLGDEDVKLFYAWAKNARKE